MANFSVPPLGKAVTDISNLKKLRKRNLLSFAPSQKMMTPKLEEFQDQQVIILDLQLKPMSEMNIRCSYQEIFIHVFKILGC